MTSCRFTAFLDVAYARLLIPVGPGVVLVLREPDEVCLPVLEGDVALASDTFTFL